MKTPKVLLAIPLLALAIGCKKEPPPPPPTPVPVPTAVPTPAPVVFGVRGITLGKSVGADKRIAEATDTFGPKDKIFAVVETDGAAAAAKLEAKWTFAGAKGAVPVHSGSMDLVNLTGPAQHEFHIEKKTAWPKGAYAVEVFLNGASAGKKDFKIQ